MPATNLKMRDLPAHRLVFNIDGLVMARKQFQAMPVRISQIKESCESRAEMTRGAKLDLRHTAERVPPGFEKVKKQYALKGGNRDD